MATAETTPNRKGPVPPAAEAIVALLNSRAHISYDDKLVSPESAGPILRRFGLADGRASKAQLDQIRTVRTILMAILDAESEANASAQWAQFTARTSGALFQHEFSATGPIELRQVRGDLLIGRIARDVATLIESGNWLRIRACANDVCRSVFYDTTKSRTQRWHSYEICGNRHNVASYRARAAGRD
jgi:predicted RNA-binding Zn ribbon-like protein